MKKNKSVYYCVTFLLFLTHFSYKCFSQSHEILSGKKKKKFDLSFFGGLNAVNQSIDSKNADALFIYKIDKSTNDSKNYGIGQFVGVRIDRENDKKISYAASFYVDRITSGINYTYLPYNDLLFSYQSNIYPKDVLLYSGISSFFKFRFINNPKHDCIIIAGPALSYRISNGNVDNAILNSYQTLFPKGNFGIEFSNKSFYKIFVHYSFSLNKNSFTKFPIQSDYSQFNLGFSVKAKYF